MHAIFPKNPDEMLVPEKLTFRGFRIQLGIFQRQRDIRPVPKVKVLFKVNVLKVLKSLFVGFLVL